MIYILCQHLWKTDYVRQYYRRYKSSAGHESERAVIRHSICAQSFFDILENDDVFGTEGRADPRYNPASDGINPLDIAPSRRKNEEAIKVFDDWAKKNDYTLHDTLLSVVPHSLQHYFT